jgi:hypothetical protein
MNNAPQLNFTEKLFLLCGKNDNLLIGSLKSQTFIEEINYLFKQIKLQSYLA